MTKSKEQRQFDGLTCPDCDGPIFEPASGPLRFECLVGHSYSSETMRVEHCKKIENALWSATATLEEHATLLRRIAKEQTGTGTDHDIHSLEDEARQKEAQASELRAFIEKVCGSDGSNSPQPDPPNGNSGTAS